MLRRLAWSPRLRIWFKGCPHLRVRCCQITFQEGCFILWSYQSDHEGLFFLQGLCLLHFHILGFGDIEMKYTQHKVYHKEGRVPEDCSEMVGWMKWGRQVWPRSHQRGRCPAWAPALRTHSFNTSVKCSLLPQTAAWLPSAPPLGICWSVSLR